MPVVDRVAVTTYVVPTDLPESDGTLAWESTTMVVVEIEAGNQVGLGYTYGTGAVAEVIRGELVPVVAGRRAMEISAAHSAMRAALRNNGCAGVGGMAVSAVDVALWDLKAKLLDLSLTDLLGRFREGVPVYGSGGFTSYTDAQLERQLCGWVEQGIARVKMKVGRDPASDPDRVARARQAIGRISAGAQLMVDANGAYRSKEALHLGREFSGIGVKWFEEPVPSGDFRCLADLSYLREQLPMDVAGGEYACVPDDFQKLAPAVDVVQADATRCLGISGFLQAATIAYTAGKRVSAHCAPTIHRHLGSSVDNFEHMEWFHDHVRIERFFFDGFAEPEHGRVANDRDRPGLGVVLRREDAEQFRVK